MRVVTSDVSTNEPFIYDYDGTVHLRLRDDGLTTRAIHCPVALKNFFTCFMLHKICVYVWVQRNDQQCGK